MDEHKEKVLKGMDDTKTKRSNSAELPKRSKIPRLIKNLDSQTHQSKEIDEKSMEDTDSSVSSKSSRQNNSESTPNSFFTNFHSKNKFWPELRKTKKTQKKRKHLSNKNEAVRLTRSQVKILLETATKSGTRPGLTFDNLDNPSTSSSSEPTSQLCPISDLMSCRFKSSAKKSLKRRCKNQYYTMDEMIAKYQKTGPYEEISSDDESSQVYSTPPVGENLLMEPTVNALDILFRNDNQDLNIKDIVELKDIGIFETDSDDDIVLGPKLDNETTPRRQTDIHEESNTNIQPTKKMMFVAPMDSKGDHRRDKSLREHPAKRQLFQILPKTPKKNQKEKAELEKNNKVDETKNNDDKKSVPSAKCRQKKYNIEVIEEGDEVIDIEEQLGRLVFANLAGLQWWPGLIVKGSMCNLYTEDIGCSWVYWFGDHKVSLVTHERIIPFLANFNDKCHGKGKMFQKALLESIHIFGSRCGLKMDSLSDDYLLAWAKRGFKFKPHDQRTKAETACDIPETVTVHLKMIGDDVLKKVANKSVPKSKGAKQQKPDTRENAIDAVKEGKCSIQDVCIGCSDLNVELVDQHPLFKGGVCGNCKSDVLETMFALDEDNNNAFCSICGCGGTLFVCDKDTCNRVYCVDCIDEIAGSEILEKIEKVSKWECFLCMPYHTSSHGLLQPRHDWRQRIVQFFETEVIDKIPKFDHLQKKRPLRVLSLFDGIGTGILVLKELGLEIEEYHASEIDQDAIMVTSVHHGDQVKQLGDVTLINENMISKLLPVDLLIGGSPCNDLSIANPDKKGFDFGGTGILFFDFVRILEIIRKQQTKDRHLFWLYENVASMKLEYKKVISRFLKCPAARWDSLYFSAQNRSRYFWGNIPGLYSTPAISTYSHQRVTLNSCLAQNCNREATVDRIRTVTTRTNSLRLGKDDKGFPVKMDGMDAGIWIPELERVFGFPSHYTDVGNLPPTRRQKLLGKSWSVTVLKNILMPLKQYYACSEEQQ